MKQTLTTDGPLANVHASGAIQARSLSLNISGKISSANNLHGSIIRSFDYTSHLGENYSPQLRALKVSEHMNTALLDEYIVLSKQGEAIHKINGQSDTPFQPRDITLLFENDSWIIKGNNADNSAQIHLPIKVETDLKIQTSHLSIFGTLMVAGDLTASGELNINTGTPFDKALIVDNNIQVNKLVTIGRIHGSGNFTAQAEVNIMGNAEIDGNVTLYGDTRINFLDNVYKAALYEAQLETTQNEAGETAIDTTASMTLVHSQLFSDINNNNSVVLFTFVEGDYLLNEQTLFDLIRNGQINEFKFKSYLYGASIDYGSQLQKFSGLSPYYANKLILLDQFRAQGIDNIKISESLDLAPSRLYHSFEDGKGNKLGTFLIYALNTQFDANNPLTMSSEQRAQARYNLENREQIEAQMQADAAVKQAEQKQALLADTQMDETSRQQLLQELAEQEAAEAAIDKDALKAQTTQDRIDEWVSYKELASSNMEITLEEVVTSEMTEARFFKKIKRFLRRVFRKVTFTDCHRRNDADSIAYVYNTTYWSSYGDTGDTGDTDWDWEGGDLADTWTTKISLNNAVYNYCTPISAAMILKYHRLRKYGSGAVNQLYTDDRSHAFRHDAAQLNPYVRGLAKDMLSSKRYGTWDQFFTVPMIITHRMHRNNTRGFAFTTLSTVANRNWQHSNIRGYIRRNNPVIYTAFSKHGTIDGKSVSMHSMPVIGYKRQYYRGVCWKRAMPQRKWILVDSTWRSSQSTDDIGHTDYGNSRGYLRFDMRSNYLSFGSLTYIRSY